MLATPVPLTSSMPRIGVSVSAGWIVGIRFALARRQRRGSSISSLIEFGEALLVSGLTRVCITSYRAE
jgi:hypothetical protein